MHPRIEGAGNADGEAEEWSGYRRSGTGQQSRGRSGNGRSGVVKASERSHDGMDLYLPGGFRRKVLSHVPLKRDERLNPSALKKDTGAVLGARS